MEGIFIDEETAKLIAPKLEALRSFIYTVSIAGQNLRDMKSREDYLEMYDDLKKTLNDPSFEVFAPPIPHFGTTSWDATLWAEHALAIVESGNRVVAYLDSQIKQVPLTTEKPFQPLRCFLSYRFADESRQYSNEVRQFLELNGIEVVSGDRFEPRSISEKISGILASDLDFGILIVTKEGESMWTRDEVNQLWSEEKFVIVLVEEGASFKPGLQGDIEWIQFLEGHVSDTFIKILEGISYIREKTGRL